MQALAGLLYPQLRCAACAEELPLLNGLCGECTQALMDALLSEEAAPGVYGGYAYRDAARNLVRRLKFSNVRLAAAPLARRMADVIEQHSIAYDALVPVPIGRKRMRRRGYNQSMILCREVSRLNGSAILRPQCLVRQRDTAEQTSLDLVARHQNVHGAFRASQVEGLSLLLVDDVYTTGATSRECVRALLEAGAAGVQVLCATVAQLDFE